ncbi:hypothetical protein SFRURICE_003368 [Spodoptera frugiperda]|nr:hypothetical protein SFRURICE_003368 [Spodoptera frugiperda]
MDHLMVSDQGRPWTPFKNYIYRHAFNPRRGRQRCTLWHVMPLCTPTFHNLYCESHVIGDSVLPLRNFRKTEKSPVILCPTRESNPRPLARQSQLQPLGQRGSLLKINYKLKYPDYFSLVAQNLELCPLYGNRFTPITWGLNC